MSKFMTLKPRMSEKAYASSKANNTYVFQVPTDSNKVTIAEAVALQFEVTVEDVRIAIIKGKSKQAYRKRSRPVSGKRTNMKKAFVRIKAGEKINIFGDVEEAEKQAEKAAEKQAKKAAKKPAKKSEGDK